MKYPLTENAKQAAKVVVDKWNEGTIQQHTSSKSNSGVPLTDLAVRLGMTSSGVLLELAKYGLVEIYKHYSGDGRLVHVDILLLQELRNAVDTDFDVSEYFLTFNAIGNIIVGSTTGPVQGVGYTNGNISQNIEHVVDTLEAQLGEDFLQSQIELREAIEALRQSTENERQSNAGKVISELGRCLEHGSNAASVVTALTFLIMVFRLQLGI